MTQTPIFNAGVTKYHGRYVMVFRNDYGGTEGTAHFEGTNMGVAFSDDGVIWEPQPEPWIEWQSDEIQRAYDPRLTVIEGRCYLCFAVDTHHGIRGGIAVTDDFDTWEVLSLSAPDNRNGDVFGAVDGAEDRLRIGGVPGTRALPGWYDPGG